MFKLLLIAISTFFVPMVHAQLSTASFIALPPCRVVDTRSAPGLLGGPSMLANSRRTFPITSSSCGVPPGAAAYSFNVTVVPVGPLGYLTIFPTGQPQPNVSTLNSYQGQIVANAAILEAGTNGSVDVYVTNETDVILDVDGYFSAAPTPANSGNTILGSGALASNTTGGDNTAIGGNALTMNTTGLCNTAVGFGSLASYALGDNNTAIGYLALGGGFLNTAIGSRALMRNGGADNVAVGNEANEYGNGNDNTSVGSFALYTAEVSASVAMPDIT